LLFAPFYVEVNSVTNLYRLRFHRLMSLALKSNTEGFAIEMRFLFWKKDILLTEHGRKDDNDPKHVPESRAQMPAIDWDRVRNVLKSFHLNTCDISLDTGNMPLNGILYPIVYTISACYRKQITINFSGHNHVVVEVENNLARIIYAYYKP
jgi:hypothetical protein